MIKSFIKLRPERQEKTKIIVKCDVGFGNALYIRGKGAGLNWEKGKKLTNISADEWVWESDASFETCEFKVLINDERYENGDNHRLYKGASIRYSPSF